MVSKFFLRPTSPLSFVIVPSTTHLYHFPKPSFSGLTVVSVFSATAADSLPYGPSLRKGKIPPSLQQKQRHCYQSHPVSEVLSGLKKETHEGEEEEEGDNVIDEEKFTRVFDLAALRVPAKDCFALESRIRGHLLNWPRIRNIARVPGDEVEEELVSLLGVTQSWGEDDEVGKVASLQRRIYGKAEGDGEELSPVLYRERLAKEFNAKGFVKFRNLAKISRPKKKKKMKQKEGKGDEEKRRGRDEFAVVEVVEEGNGDEWRGLLGDEFKGQKKWMGSTRLLLLDERYAEKTLEELPQAVKVAFI